MDLTGIPSFIWELPTQLIVIVLLSLGVFVTRREHANMKEMMVYFRDMNDRKDKLIENQAIALSAYKEIVEPMKSLIKVSKEKVEGEEHVS